MNVSVAGSTLTTAELFALPEDGIERDLIRGELLEYPMTKRNRRHSRVLMSVGRIIGTWAIENKTGGEVTGGEAGVRLQRDPETTVGVDAAYFSAESISQMPSNQPWYEGAPVLAVEILSPSDTHEDVVKKIGLYLESGVQVVWILDPDFETLTVYRPRAVPVMLSSRDTLSDVPELPGFNVPVRDFFI